MEGKKRVERVSDVKNVPRRQTLQIPSDRLLTLYVRIPNRPVVLGSSPSETVPSMSLLSTESPVVEHFLWFH